MSSPKDESNEFDEDFDDIENEEEEAKPENVKGQIAKSEDSLGDFDEDFDLDTEVEKDKVSAKGSDDDLDFEDETPKVTTKEKVSTPDAPKKNIPLEEVPLCVVLEVGRIQMSIKKLLELQPGNMLELDIHPEAGVDMVVNGRKVARGELLKIGEAIGVRISERL